jgi:hypothetical protein
MVEGCSGKRAQGLGVGRFRLILVRRPRVSSKLDVSLSVSVVWSRTRFILFRVIGSSDSGPSLEWYCSASGSLHAPSIDVCTGTYP